MALSGSISTNKYTTSSHGNIGLTLSWTATQSVANNTSTIKWTLKSYGSMSSGYYVQAGPVTVVIAGKTVLSQTSRFNMKGDGAYKKTGTLTVTHNENGSKSFSASVKAAIYSASVNCTASGSFTLNKIDRYALLAEVGNFTNESYPTIRYTNPAGTSLVDTLRVRITWKDTSDVEHSTPYVALNDEGGEYTFTSETLRPQDITDMLSACPNSNSLAVKFDLSSLLQGTEYHDLKDAVMNVVNANPVFTVQTHYEEDPNSPVLNITHDNQIIIQRQSTLLIYVGTAQAAANKGAQLISGPYILNFNGQDYAPNNDGYVAFVRPDISGTYRAMVTATDTRGNQGISYVDIPILDWREPKADCLLERQNSFETVCDLKVTADISPLGGLNASHLAIYEKHRIIDTSVWSASSPVPNDTLTNVSLLNTNEWEMEIEVSDAFATVTYRLTVGKGIPMMLFDVHRNSIAFNEIPDEDDQFKIGGTLKVKPNDEDPGIVLPHVYSTTEQVVGYWLDGRPIYKKVIELGADVSVNANAWKNSALTVEEDIIVVDGKAMYYSSQYDMFTVWNFIAVQTNTSNKKAIDLYNARDAACNVINDCRL